MTFTFYDSINKSFADNIQVYGECKASIYYEIYISNLEKECFIKNQDNKVNQNIVK
jgi:hypothetical protein